MTRHALLTYAQKYWGGWRRGALAALVWLEAVARQARGRNEMNGELRRLAGDWLADRPLSARWRVRRAAKLLATCAGREDGHLPAAPEPTTALV